MSVLVVSITALKRVGASIFRACSSVVTSGASTRLGRCAGQERPSTFFPRCIAKPSPAGSRCGEIPATSFRSVRCNGQGLNLSLRPQAREVFNNAAYRRA